MAKRLFDEHKIRKTQNLDGAWSFKTDKNNEGIANKWYNGIKDAETALHSKKYIQK